MKSIFAKFLTLLALGCFVVVTTGCGGEVDKSKKDEKAEEHGHSHDESGHSHEDGEKGEHKEGSHKDDGDKGEHNDKDGSHKDDGDKGHKEGSGHDKDDEGHGDEKEGHDDDEKHEKKQFQFLSTSNTPICSIQTFDSKHVPQ